MSRKMNAGDGVALGLEIGEKLKGASLPVLEVVHALVCRLIDAANEKKVKRGIGAAANEAAGVLPGSGA